MSLIVQKFGGSSVKDAKHIRNVAGIIAETYLQGNDVIVVSPRRRKSIPTPPSGRWICCCPPANRSP